MDEIYLKAGKEPPAALICLSDVKDWLVFELNLGHEKGKEKGISLGNLMLKFDILEEDDAREIEEQRLLVEMSQPKRKKKHHHHHEKSKK